MKKNMRFLIVVIMFLALSMFMKMNNFRICPDGSCQAGGTVGRQAVFVSRTASTIAAPDRSDMQRDLIFLEFFSGL